MWNYKQECSKCPRAISGSFNSAREWIDHIKSQGWFMSWFGWVCPACKQNTDDATWNRVIELVNKKLKGMKA